MQDTADTAKTGVEQDQVSPAAPCEPENELARLAFAQSRTVGDWQFLSASSHALGQIEAATMWLESSSFGNGAVIPQRHTCDGENLSPPLRWGDVPSDTRSIVIICVDPDAPNGAFYHWAVCNIPASTNGLAEAASATKALAEGVNDFRKRGYGGPCPPRGDRPHHYRIQLLALSKDRLELPARPSCRQIERIARENLLEEASIVGLYSR